MAPDDLQDCRHEKVMEEIGAFLARKRAEEDYPTDGETGVLSSTPVCGLDEPDPQG